MRNSCRRSVCTVEREIDNALRRESRARDRFYRFDHLAGQAATAHRDGRITTPRYGVGSAFALSERRRGDERESREGNAELFTQTTSFVHEMHRLISTSGAARR